MHSLNLVLLRAMRNRRFKDFVCGAFYLSVGTGLLIAAPISAEARDRPGTPNEERAWVCKNDPASKPKVCFQFKNTARQGEDVDYWIEITANQNPVNAAGLWIDCTSAGFTYDFVCAYPVNENGVVRRWHGPSSWVDLKAKPDWDKNTVNPFEIQLPGKWVNLPVMVMLKDMEFDTVYCFRARAVDQGSGVISEIWSNWACTSAPAPARPAKPNPPQVTFVPGDDGRGKVGDATPASMLVEWDPIASSGEVGWIEIIPAGAQLTDYPLEYHGIDKFQVKPGDPSELQIPIPGGARPDKMVGYRVCASNIRWRSCSEPGFFQAPVASDYEQMKRETAQAPSTVLTGASGMNRTASTSKSVVFGAPKNSAATASPQIDVRGADRNAPSSDGCRAGFVRRKAALIDDTCAPPAARDRVADENRKTADRYDPQGAYGPSTCKSGFVWRDAYPGDTICVTPESRDLARDENALSASREAQ